MKWIASLLPAFLLLLPLEGHTQINDCATAQVVCDDGDLAFNPDGPGIDDFADPDNNEGCITALEQNSAWYYFEIDPAAPPNLVLGFIIHPKGGFGEDYDWALFGPDVSCGDLGSPIRCSSSSAACGFCPDTGMGMGTTDVSEGPGTGDGFVSTLVVQPGQGFYLMIDNWLGTTNGFILSWTDSAAPYLNCDAEPPCALSAIAGPDIDACEGDPTLVLDGNSFGSHGNETYAWTGTNGGTAFLSDPDSQNPSLLLPAGFNGTITYTLTVIEGMCFGTDEMELTIFPLPVVTISQAGPFCENEPPQNLSASPGGGIWDGAANGNTFDPAANGPGIHTVTYTYTDFNNCSAEATIEIEVYENPEVTIDPDPATFCDDDDHVILTATATGGSGNYTFTWDTPDGMDDGDTYEASISGLYTVSVTDDNGCVHSASTTVTALPNPTVEIMNPGPICGSDSMFTLSATPPGGTFDGTIVSPEGVIHPNMLPPGTYSVTYYFTASNNCEGSDGQNVTILATPDAVASNNGPLCDGQTILLSGNTNGTGTNISYHWTGPNGYTSNVQNPADATTGGVYSLTVTIDNCSSAPSQTNVILTTQPDALATNSGPYCGGEPIELFGTTATTGNSITYAWAGPNGYTSTVQNPTDATEPGAYSLVITVDGCPSAITQTDVLFSSPPDASAANSGPYCQGESIILNGTTTAPGSVINYAWSGPNGYVSNVQNPMDASEPGLYQLNVTVDGCTSYMASTVVTINSLPQPVISGQADFCTGFSSTLDAGAGYAAYEWSDASQNQTLEVFASGTYHVTVTDLNGCSGQASFTANEMTSLTPVISGTLDFCEGSGTTLDAGSGFASYVWSTGETTQTIDITSEGNYGVIVTDTDGCTGSANVTTVANPIPNVVIGGSTTYCIGGFTILDAGAGYQSYAWSNSSVSQTITVNSPGAYSVDIIDANGCSGSAMVSVIESTSLSPVITGNNAFCQNGSTTLNAGSGFATYLWSDGSMAQNLVVNTTGSYSVTVSDGQGCSGEATVSISEVLPPSAVLQPAASLCNTVAGGSVINLYDLIFAGDMNGTWKDEDQSGAAGLFTSLNFNNVAPGDYRFIYTTNSAIDPCPETEYQVIITVIDCTCPDVFFFTAPSLCNAGDVLDVSTLENTDETGSWSLIQNPAGTNPAILTGTLFDATGADPGDYTLHFTLVNQPPPGCPSDYPVTIQVDDANEAGVADPPVDYCFGDDQLVALADLISGEDANGTWIETSFTHSQGFAFNSAAGTFQTGSRVPGLYTFEYSHTTNGSCPGDAVEVTVEITPLPAVVVDDFAALDCANPVQSLNAEGSSTGPEYTIVWTGPGIIADGNENTPHPTIDQQGNYLLTITNILTGCFDEGSVTVVANTAPPTGALITSQDPSCFGDQNGMISIDQVFGGTAPYLYSLNNAPFNTVDLYSDLASGNYTLEIEDVNGCRWDTTLILTAPQELTINIGSDIEIGLGESGIVQAIVNLAPGQMDTLVWSPAEIIDCIDIVCLEAHVYAVNTGTLSATVYDQHGCHASDELLVVVNKERRIYIPSIFSPNGDGINDDFFISADPDQITQIKRLAIFTRWGETLFEDSHYQPNDPESGWDGRFHGELVNPGVFIYTAEIEYIDGLVEVITGDVTLIR